MGWDKPQPLQVYSVPDDSLMWVDLEQEANRATEILKGKIVAQVWRHQKQEMDVEFTDGTRLFVDCNANGLDISITFDGLEADESGE